MNDSKNAFRFKEYWTWAFVDQSCRLPAGAVASWSAGAVPLNETGAELDHSIIHELLGVQTIQLTCLASRSATSRSPVTRTSVVVDSSSAFVARCSCSCAVSLAARASSASCSDV